MKGYGLVRYLGIAPVLASFLFVFPDLSAVTLIPLFGRSAICQNASGVCLTKQYLDYLSFALIGSGALLYYHDRIFRERNNKTTNLK